MSAPRNNRRLSRTYALLGVLPLLAAAWACSAESGTRTPGTGSGTQGSNGTTDSGSGGGSSTNGSGTNGTTDGATTDGATTDGGTTTGGSEPVNFNLDCASPAVGSPVLRLLTRQELTNTLNAVFPELTGQWQSTLPANQVAETGFDNSSSAVVGAQTAEELLNTALSVGALVSGNALGTLLPCSASSADRTCASEFITEYGQRLYRRPLTQTEQDRYLSFYDSAMTTADFPTAIKWITAGLIQSPSAVYRSEIGTDMGNGTRELDSYELATELAYTYTGGPPSDELLANAASGNLGDLSTVAETMLDTEAGKQTLQRFFDGYVGYTRVNSTQKPGVDGFETAKLDMIDETRAFIDTVVFQNNEGVRELLTAPTTNPSTALANFYGFPAPASDFGSVQRPSGQGVGILAQGAFLASHANADASSPTKRGVFTFSHLLCQPKPEVPNGVPELQPPAPGVTTTRQRYEENHATGPCATCHRKFDPMGFGFEHFDEGGRYREQESGLTIDASGSVMDAAGGELFAFDGQEQLMQGLADQSVVYQCFSAYLATYAFGTAESCLGPTRAADLEAGTIGIKQAYAALAAEPHFTQRTAQ